MTDIALPGAAGLDVPEVEDDSPETPEPGTETSPDNRRRKIAALLMLLLLAAALVAFVLWYLIFRQPFTDVIPIIDITNPPAFTTAIYGVDKPLDVAVNADGSRLIVTQTGTDRSTVILDASGNTLGVLAPPVTVVAQPTQFYVAINPVNGEIYATDRTQGAVFRYSADGAYIDEFKARPFLSDWQPLAIAFDIKGNLYIADVGAQTARIHIYDPDGALLRDIGVADGLSFPNGIAVDAALNVYVADSNNGRLLVYDETGSRIGIIARGAGEGELGMPRGVAVDGRGRVYVVDAVAHQVQMYRVQGTGDPAPLYLASFGREGTVDGAFEFPNAPAVDTRGHVYVTDWNNDRLQVWSY